MIPMMQEASKNVNPNIICKAKKYNQIYGCLWKCIPCCWLDVEWISHNPRMDYMKKINKFPTV